MKRFFALAFVIALSASLHLFAASDYLLEIEGIKGEKIKESTKSINGRVSLNGLPPGQPVLRCIVQWEGQTYTVMVDATQGVKSPRDVASGQATGKRMHKPFVVCSKGTIYDFDTKDEAITKAKELDKSTPLLLQVVKQSNGFTFQKIEWDR